MSKHGLDKFYTKSDIVDWCLKTLNLKSYDLIIEPSVGSGAFYNKIKNKNKIGIDIDPDISLNDNKIIKSDFLKWELNQFPYPKKILLLGNPPFGRNGSLALKFIKKGCLMNADIAFILPRGYKKRSVYDRIPLNYEKIIELDLPHNSFLYNGKDYDVPCVWQVYTPSNTIRQKEIIETPINFKFTNIEESNIAIRRVGVSAGKIFDNTNVKPSSHYFIHSEYKNILMKNVKPHLFSYDDTTGPRSISKNELVRVLDNIIKNNKL